MDTSNIIQVEVLLIAGVVILLIYILARFRSRKTKERIQTQQPLTRSQKIWAGIFRLLKLTAFTLGALIFVLLAVLVYLNFAGFEAESAPAPSQVDVPADLPFKVEEITFLSEDGLRMAGWFVPSQNGATIILLHPYGGNRLSMRWHAEQLVGAGYGVLMYDERASGESEGTYRSYGWEDPRDVGGALAFLRDRQEVNMEKVGIAGCSIGAQIALQSAVPYPELGAVWADGPSSVRAADMPSPENPLMALFKFGNYIADWTYEVKLDLKAPPPMIEIIGQIAPRPILLVGGGRPLDFVGSEEGNVRKYANYAGENAQVWIIPEAVHCDGPDVQPEAYSQKMIAFFNGAFGLK
jgi:fermentation-respiration switch protein FrsA (DUF1100 family)